MTHRFYEQSKKAFEVYLVRGCIALDCLKADRLDEAIKALKDQHAAWCNFKIAYDMLEDKKLRQDLDARIKARLANVLPILEELSYLTEKIKIDLQQQMVKLKRERKKIQLFKSEKSHSSHLLSYAT